MGLANLNFYEDKGYVEGYTKGKGNICFTLNGADGNTYTVKLNIMEVDDSNHYHTITWNVVKEPSKEAATCLEDISKLSEANFRFTSLNLSHNKIQDLTALQNLPEDITFMRHYNWQQKVYSNYFWYEMEDFTQRKKIVPDGFTGLHTKPGPGGTQVLGYFTDGVMDLAYEDLAEYEGVIYFVGQGVIRSDYTGTVYKTTSGTAVYGRNVENVQELAAGYEISEGKLDISYEGINDVETKAGCPYVVCELAFKNGRLRTDYTGVAVAISEGVNGVIERPIYVRKGIADYSFEGACATLKEDGSIEDAWYIGLTAYEARVYQEVETGLHIYIKKGKLDRTFSGYSEGYYLTNGIEDKTFTGLAENGALIKNGALAQDYDGLYTDETTGATSWLKEGLPDPSISKAYLIDGKAYYFNKGVHDQTVNGYYLTQETEGQTPRWIAFKDGALDTSITGFVEVDYTAKDYYEQSYKGGVYLKDGVQDLTYTGLARKANSDDTDTYCVENGYLYVRTGVYMPVSYDETLPEAVFYGKYFEKGKYCTNYTGIAESFENGFTYYVENGIVNTQRNETYMEEVDGYLYIYYVKNGVVTGSKKEKL